MPVTVWGAFNKFREATVDLDPKVSDTARSSRGYLYDQLKSLDRSDTSFPELDGGFLPYGSFARKTKIRPLDDIDFFALLNGTGTSVTQSSNDPYTYWLYIRDQTAPLSRYPDGHGYVHSIKLLNAIKSSLSTVSSYKKAEIKRNQQAVTLSPSSYDWVFDIVPAVGITGWDGKTISYYLIPNGSGDWMKSDPTKDATNITTVNKRHGGDFLPLVRLLKFWNKRVHKPQLMAYYFETLALKVFEYASAISSFPTAVEYFFQNCPLWLLTSCPDPKGLGPALDADVVWDTKNKVLEAVKEAATYAGYALMYERQGDAKQAIYWWGRIFGPEFPSYG